MNNDMQNMHSIIYSLMRSLNVFSILFFHCASRQILQSVCSSICHFCFVQKCILMNDIFREIKGFFIGSFGPYILPDVLMCFWYMKYVIALYSILIQIYDIWFRDTMADVKYYLRYLVLISRRINLGQGEGGLNLIFFLSISSQVSFPFFFLLINAVTLLGIKQLS